MYKSMKNCTMYFILFVRGNEHEYTYGVIQRRK